MSGLRVSGTEVGSPSPFLIFAVARSVGRKSATAAAITTTSAAFAASSTASRISRVVCTRRTSTEAGGSRPAIVPATSVTSAPRWAATRASAYP